jgi:hypothetical protein
MVHRPDDRRDVRPVSRHTIAFEGAEACGKSSQAARYAERIGALPTRVLVVLVVPGLRTLGSWR